MPLSPSERRLRAQKAGLTGWANTVDRSARGRHANAGLLAKYERQADPDGTMDPRERAKRASTLLKQHYADMRWKAVEARRRRVQEKLDRAAEMKAGRDKRAGAA